MTPTAVQRRPLDIATGLFDRMEEPDTSRQIRPGISQPFGLIFVIVGPLYGVIAIHDSDLIF